MTTPTPLQAKALYANSADNDEELSFETGDVLTVVERDVAGLVGWWLCAHAGRIGIAPGNRLRLLSPVVNAVVSNGSTSNPDRQHVTDARQYDISTTVKHRPSTAPVRGQNTQNANNSSKNALVVPHKSGNVYVYDDGVQQCVDYDVPSARQHTPNPPAWTSARSPGSVSTQDYDVPPSVSAKSVYCGRVADDVEFGDYDLLSPPHPHPASDVSSNRSSVTSVMSTGSLSSGCSGNVRSAQSPWGSVVIARNSATHAVPHSFSHDLQVPTGQSPVRRCVSEAISDSSGDSGIVLQTVLNSPSTRANVGGISCRQNGATCHTDCLDYDIPAVVSVNGDGGLALNVIQERETASHQQRSPASPRSEARCPVMNGGDLPWLSDAKSVRRRQHIDELRDCVMRSVQRFLGWTGLVSSDTGRDLTVTRQCYGQAKLAGLAVRTSLKELVAMTDEQSSEFVRSHAEPLSGSLYEIDRRLDSLIESGSDVHPSRLAASTSTGSQRATSSCRDQLLAVAEIISGLSDHVRRFADFVATNSAVVIRLQDDVDVKKSSTTCVDSKVSSPPPPPQRRDSHHRDRPPLSPSGVTSPRSRRPPLGKPPPLKPKPPKSVTWKRPPQTATEPQRAVWSRVPTSTPSSVNTSPANGSSDERRVAKLNQANNSSTDGWNDVDCDYVSIVRQVEREMESLQARPLNKDARHVRCSNTTSTSSAAVALSDDDRELVSFYAAQISSQAADVDAAAAEFYHSCCSYSAASVDAFIRRSRFVVLAAHRLVYVGDVIARHVTDQLVRDRVADVANSLCDRLKAVVVATRHAALTFAGTDSVQSEGVVQSMMNCVRQAAEGSRRVCDVISAIACQ